MSKTLDDVTFTLAPSGKDLMVEGTGSEESHAKARAIYENLGKDSIQLLMLWDILQELKELNDREPTDSELADLQEEFEFDE